jgi:uncharacterized protein YbjT (DUF2867 family)
MDSGDQSIIPPTTQGHVLRHPANRRQIRSYPELACKQSRSCDNQLDLAAFSEHSPGRAPLGVIICHMLVLVTGASGFVGSLLVPVLRAQGHDVRALGRDTQRVHVALERSDSISATAGSRGDLEVLRGDLLTAEGLTQGLDGVQVAYYLIHSMERSNGKPSSFEQREQAAAESFAAAAAAAGVRRIVFLGGLVPRTHAYTAADTARADTAAHARVSRHLASREHVERVLLDAVPDSLSLRASIVIGARSRSFRLLVRLVERMPVLPLPAWHSFRTQPIDARDVTAMLAACATTSLTGRSLDIAGPDVLSYGEMLTTIAERMLVNRPTIGLGVNLTAITARVAAAIAGEDPELVVPLMEGLYGDLLPADDRAAELLGVRLHSFGSSVEHALAEWESFEALGAR